MLPFYHGTVFLEEESLERGIGSGRKEIIFGKCLKRKDELRVACVQGIVDSPQLPDGRASATKLVVVFDVVMDKGEVMEKLDGNRRRQCFLKRAERIGDEEQ